MFLAAEKGVGRKVATVARRAAAIATIHRHHGYDSPTGSPEVRAVLAGIRRIHGIRQEGKAALDVGEVRRTVSALDAGTLVGRRDRALIFVGFAGALRVESHARVMICEHAFPHDLGRPCLHAG
jgi:hypothetical protein